ncbi:hypothetical protein RvY_04613-2 [Ramazzottius varieornatus]|uniref:non-specific serine/threonine protein kinase n=1 Tax=Ramazzottius varieornatus TaxID=947166 RepID=A0A1D1UVQ7_RAMVA|nr:hypothetical protein RvY_04613-2 [Ramazzottius varieornatus]
MATLTSKFDGKDGVCRRGPRGEQDFPTYLRWFYQYLLQTAVMMDPDVVNLETDKIESLDFLSSQGVDDHPAEPMDFWARLMPLNSSLLTVQYLTSDEFSVGIDVDCDCVLPRVAEASQQATPYGRGWKGYSRTHFEIHRVDGVALLEDKSSNGTYINGVKVGKFNKRIIQSNDDISLANKRNRVFTFMAKEGRIHFDFDLPEDFTSQYVISKKLGSGACGDVYLASTKDYGEKYAAKVIKKSGFGPDNKQSCVREVEIMRRTDHPNVALALYVCLQFMGGGELFDWIQNYLPSVEKSQRCTVVRTVFRQIVTAVKHLHEKGIVHRDLKPENILLSDKDASVVKITDFGLSKLIDCSVMKTRCGTPSYWAPEVIDSDTGTYTSAVDCWSLGVVLFAMLAGYPAFSNDYIGSSLEKQIRTANYKIYPPAWETINPLAKDLMEKLLVISPTERLTVDGILAHPWLEQEEAQESQDSTTSDETVVQGSPETEESTPTEENMKEGVQWILSSVSAPAVLQRRPEGCSLGGKRKGTDLDLSDDDQDVSDCEMPSQKRLKVSNSPNKS